MLKDPGFTSPADQFCRRFTFAEIQAATRNFSVEFIIGKDGFGTSYKGIIDDGATVVSIKRLDPMSKQGGKESSKQGGKELSTEIEMLSKFRHRHVVSLIGYCDNNDEIILVNEYMENGSLADHLYKEKSKYGSNSNMSWVKRVKICIEVAQALDYFHTKFHKVIHGDVRSSNILLDENWAAKISGFGVSAIVPEKPSHVSTHFEGTLGYCDPEYFLTRRLTKKSDVYSFGVVLLEVFSGRRAVDSTLPEDQRSLVQWGQQCIKKNNIHWLIDPNLRWAIEKNSLKVFLKIAEQCLHFRSKKRPTMSEVVASLECALASNQKKDSSVLYEDFYEFGETFDNRKAKGVQSDIVFSSTILKSLPLNSPIGQSEEIEKTSFAEDTSSDQSTVSFVDFDKYGLKRKDISMWCGTECHLMNSGLSKLPENMNLPVLRELLLQDNYDLSEIPPSFFEFMPALQVLDMSRTSIKYLPPSISNLVELQKLLLRGCKLLMELPAEIRALKNLEVFDLVGTELIYIPKEIEMLTKLEHLEVSLCSCADEYISEIKENGEIIPRKALSKLLNLKELSIFVDPDCEWWYTEVEAVIQDLFSLEKLETVKLYFPTVELLQKFLQLPRVEFQSLSNFRLIVGRHDQRIISHVPPDLQDRFEILEKCLKYVNGKGNIDGIGQALKQARALFLDRHWTIDRLSTFKANEMDKLRFCLLVECNEMITVIDGGDNVDKSNGGKPILGLLQYLSIHYMKKLESILVGPLASGCLYNLHILAIHTCPKLTTIFNVGLLSNLVHLKELIVEDCPKVESLVTVESSHLESGKKFLPSLEKISLLHLPGLVSISSGLCVAPRLQRIVVYNCLKLQSLFPAEMSSVDIEEIKGESEWWEALEWKSNQPEYLRRVFVPLRRDGLMNQLAEARNTHNTLSMIQNTNKNQERSEAPKLGNWESEDVPHVDYFNKASDIQESELPVARTIPGRSRLRSRPATYDDENERLEAPKFGDWETEGRSEWASELSVAPTIPGRSQSKSRPATHDDENENNMSISGIREKHEEELKNLTLTTQPLRAIKLFILAVIQYLKQSVLYLLSHRGWLMLLSTLMVIVGLLLTAVDPHEKHVEELLQYVNFGLWWVSLGVASSIGLGSGLHTFVLHLGPHIALFTIKAVQCGRVDIKSAPYDTIQLKRGPSWLQKNCSDFGPPLFSSIHGSQVPLSSILPQVQLEAILWGMGTALGELPPYLISRAASMSGTKVDAMEELNVSSTKDAGVIATHINQMKRWFLSHPQYLNFFTILVLASVPNPLFDLAGIMCGQFGIPFWKFFLSTLIGKAIIKTHIQTVFVISVCNNQLLHWIENELIWVLSHIPGFASVLPDHVSKLHKMWDKYMVNAPPLTLNIKVNKWDLSFTSIWNGIVWLMILNFFSTIVTSTAQRYLKKQQEKELAKLSASEHSVTSTAQRYLKKQQEKELAKLNNKLSASEHSTDNSDVSSR